MKVKKGIVRHYQENDGSLMIWGKIKKYWFHYDENKVIAFSPDGTIIEGENDAPVQKAILTIRGKELTAVLHHD